MYMSYYCPKCDMKFEKGTKFCQTCGCNLELEYIENPICPKCKKVYPTNTKFCVIDGSKLVREQDLIPKCVICNTPYSDDVKFCPRDGGVVSINLDRRIGGYEKQEETSLRFANKKIYPKASNGNRFLAALTDSVISLLLSIPGLFFIFIAHNEFLFNLIGFLLILIPIGYNFLKDSMGQSIGKKEFGLMVVNLDNNAPCNKKKSLFRNFISSLVSSIPFVGWLIEPIVVLTDKDGRKLGDKAANTQVIDKKNYKNKEL